MPSYCEWTAGRCATRSDEDFLGKLGAMDDPNSRLLHAQFVANCEKLVSEAKCVATSETLTFCEWDVSTALCVPMPASALGLDVADDTTLLRSACARATDAARCEPRACAPTQVLDEAGSCVDRPWYDWVGCDEELRQRACPFQESPNPTVNGLCPFTCSRARLTESGAPLHDAPTADPKDAPPVQNP